MDPNLFAYLDGTPPQFSGKGAFCGVKVAIQPNLSVRKWPTEAGSAALENYVAPEDAAAVESLRQRGATIVGSARMSELGFGLVGDTAARVLADGCDAVLITDTLGEARHVALAAGGFGYKPSFGICSRFGLIGLIPSMECLSAAAHSPAEAGRIVGAYAGADGRDFSMLTDGIPDFSRIDDGASNVKTVGVIRECVEMLEPDESKAFRNGLSKAGSLGIKIRDVSLPDFELFRTVHHVIGSVEASSSVGKYDGVRYGHRAPGTENWNDMYIRSRAESFGTLVKCYVFQGGYFQYKDFAAFEDACRIRRRLVDSLRAVYRSVDLLALPTRRLGSDPAIARTVSDVYDAFTLTLPANVAGLPAVSLSGFVKVDATDLGLQFIAPRLDDANLLGFAAKLQASEKGN
jgi:aspartyl-tRNA(Asn)/glutamyl-tRNA(Gln) amidotransferase subunit A